MKFSLSNAIDTDKIFLTRKSQLSSRLDPAFYQPSLVTLEASVRKVTSNCLRDYVVRMAGGATPSTKDAETHYTSDVDGVPFIRVQNLSTTGKLNLEDCRRITRATHEGLLARSRLSGGELLVKITGVGRMAIASVVPDGFEGNINQHIVAIRTKDSQTSEALAAFLNLDISEQLASRRSTGGTRPALDYPALLSIPIIFNKRIPELINCAVKKYEEKRALAKSLLERIDEVILDTLEIAHETELPNTVEGRIFRRSFSNLAGGRFDASSNWKRISFSGGIYPTVKLQDHFFINPSTSLPKIEKTALVSFIPMDAVSDIFGEIKEHVTRPLGECGSYTIFQEGDLIWAKITPCMENGKSAVLSGLLQGFGFGSTEFHVFRPKTNEANVGYLYLLLRLRNLRKYACLSFSGTSGHQRVDEQFFRHLEIPLPPLAIQAEIIKKISKIKSEAQVLLIEAAQELMEAKRETEMLIFGKRILHEA